MAYGGERLLVGGDPVEADGRQPAAAAARATAPTTLGLPPSSRSGRSAHSHVVDGDRPHRAAARLVRAGAEPVAPADQRTGAERRVHLVAGEGDEVEVPGVVVGTHVDGPVGGELGGVDQDPPADGVHPLGQVVHRRDHAGHVRRAGDGQQSDPPGVEGEQPVEVVEVERPVGQGPHVHHPGPGPPRQVVRVVLEHRRQHDVVGPRSSDRASRLMASVVCRPNTTASRSGSAPTNAPTRSRACSYAAVLNRDLSPVPRCTLE